MTVAPKDGVRDRAEGYRPNRWEGTVYFAGGEPTILLGHHECLEYFDLTVYGPEKKSRVLPRFEGHDR